MAPKFKGPKPHALKVVVTLESGPENEIERATLDVRVKAGEFTDDAISAAVHAHIAEWQLTTGDILRIQEVGEDG